MDYKSLLNDKQYAAVSTESQYVRIIAGAGSGKTRVLTYRVAYLISNFHVDPKRILAIAFTNKVATEMKARASKLVDELLGSSPNLNISTFHSFCARFLRSECRYIGYPIGFTIYSDDDQMKLVKSLAEGMGYKKGAEEVKNALSYIRKMKTKGLYPEDINVSKSMYEEDKISYKFYQQYELKKAESYGLDFDDLLLKTIEILVNNPAVRDYWARKYDDILVDEFQDTNDVQYKLMKLLMTPSTSVYVVGDPDQTIYTWRGANQNIIIGFDHEYPNVETVILNQNYRSTKIILEAANKLIVHNKKRVPKDLFTSAAGGDPISMKQCSTPEAEADWVASQIAYLGRHNKNEEGDPTYDDIAILYRSSYMTRPFESALKDQGIPYRIFGGLRFYERMEVKDLLAYFNLFVNPKDNVSFERIVNVPKRGIGDVSIGRIRDEADNAHLSEYEYLLHIEDYKDQTSLSPKVIFVLSSLIKTMEETKDKLKENLEAYSGILKDFTTDIGYFSYLAVDQDPDEDRIKNVNSLFDDISHFIDKNPDSSFDQYLQNVTLLTSQDDMNGGNYVSLMTIHVAKGLEFDNVFVISMNDGSFPSMRAEMESGRDASEEERRLAYVAFTRARKKLFLSCNTAYTYVTDSHAVASPYFKEAGLELPHSEYSSNNSWTPSFGKRKSTTSFFSDGNSISPFDKEPEPVVAEKPRTNGITDWALGDRVHHEKFGDGTLVEMIDKTIIIVNFDNVGKKTLLSTHPMLSRIPKTGGKA